MEGGSKKIPAGEQKNPLQQKLEEILLGNEEVREVLGKFTEVQQQLLARLIEKEALLDRRSGALESLGRDISSRMEKGGAENSARLQEVFDSGLEKFRKVELGLSDKDRGLLEKVEGMLRKFWKLPATVAAAALLFAAIVAFLAARFYGEGVRSKEETRSEMLAGWKAQGKRLVDGEEWEALRNERVIVKGFVRDDEQGGKALVNYRKGRISANKGKPIYRDIDSDEVVKE